MVASPLAMHVRRRATTTVAVAVVTAVVAAVAVASTAVVAVPEDGWRRMAAVAAATVSTHLPVARLSVSSHPLSSEVSVFTDGMYAAVPGDTPAEGCPTSLTITGDLGASNNTFSVPASRVSIGGSACKGTTPETALVGIYGPTLGEALEKLNSTELLSLDPKMAVAGSVPEALTCGDTTWLGETAAFVFLAIEGVPTAIYADESALDRACALVVAEGAGTPPSATPTQE
ncbi:hypothetical protein MMPV_000416 [Pyropia vietnamensis]